MAPRKRPPPPPSSSDDLAAAAKKKLKGKSTVVESAFKFVEEPIPKEEARLRWPERYEERKHDPGPSSSKKKGGDCTIVARLHYTKAEEDGVTFNLGDDAHVKAEEGKPHYVCRIIEMFEAVDGTLYFTAQWYYRAEDTIIMETAALDRRRLFFSEIKDINPLSCLVEKVSVTRLNVNQDAPKTGYYCDSMYLLPFSSFINLPAVAATMQNERASSSTICKPRMMSLLDLYSGCGAMSTGLCDGAQKANIELVTKWAVDFDKQACKTLKLNHPETLVRHESAEDFCSLIMDWEKLCAYFKLITIDDSETQFDLFKEEDTEAEEADDSDENDDEVEDFEVQHILAVRFRKPKKKDHRGLYFKIRWKGYGAEDDTWEPLEALGHCKDILRAFVSDGFESKLLPLPGYVDVICGGPPCQGVSGFNRFRDLENPLNDEKNRQLTVYMDIVKYLKPKYVLMENVVDMFKLSDGWLGRYAMGKLVSMNYQARMGMMAAGAYGLPQYRMRIFIWAACRTENLPQYPLPTHDVDKRGVTPTQFERNIVAYESGNGAELRRKVLLEDALTDLPNVTNFEERDEMPYGMSPKTEFQTFIRRRDGVLGISACKSSNERLYDHRPYCLNKYDFQRVCKIPKKEGANFRDLKGVLVKPDNRVEWDPKVKRVYLAPKHPLVPNYAMTFEDGRSLKPFGRLWWTDTVSTVVGRPQPHNRILLHPEQDRVLTVRENARLQGFPDWYQLCGSVKERYIQVGNAVAVHVSRALGYALGATVNGWIREGPLLKLPENFPEIE